MNTYKTLLTTTTFIAAFAMNAAHATNGFFTLGSEKIPHTQPVSFNSDAHKGTTFWDYYYSSHGSNINKTSEMVYFDDSKLRTPYLAPLYN